MNAVIIDTNVIVMANDTGNDERRDCRERCQDRLEKIFSNGEMVVVDDERRILEEYERNADPNTRKGMGDLFVKTLLQNLRNPEVCTMVHITSTQDRCGFEEFPDDPTLSDFDPDDRKFIAVAVVYDNVHQQKAILLQAVDSQWYGLREALVNNGLEIEFICEAYIQYLYERRMER